MAPLALPQLGAHKVADADAHVVHEGGAGRQGCAAGEGPAAALLGRPRLLLALLRHK